MPQFLPTPLRPDPNADPEEQLRRIARQIAALQSENDKPRRALAEERRAVDILLAIDRLEAPGRRARRTP